MSDGTFSVRQRQQKASQSGPDLADALTTGTYETFLGGTLPSVGQGRVKTKTESTVHGDVDELRVETRRAPRLREYDRLLKSFKYSAALDAVLRKVRSLARFLPSECLIPPENIPPVTTFSLIQELIHRDGLRSALSGRDDVLLEPVLRLLVKHVTDPRFGEIVCDISMLLIGELPLRCVGIIVMEKNTLPKICIPPSWASLPSSIHYSFACGRKSSRRFASRKS